MRPREVRGVGRASVRPARVRPAALAFALVLAAAAHACAPARYEVAPRFVDDAVRDRARALEVYLVPACDALGTTGADPPEVLAQTTLVRGDGRADLGQLAVAGGATRRVGVYARARDASCVVIAAGCREVDAVARGAGTVAVDLAAVSAGPGCAAGVACAADGRCGGPGPPGDGGASCDAAALPVPTPRITGLAVPAVASSGSLASYAEDDDYSTLWRSSGPLSGSAPAWIAFDLGAVAAESRRELVVAWFNRDEPFEEGMASFNLPQDYTLDGHPGNGGGGDAGSGPPAVDAPGWVPLATATDNHFVSRQHRVTFAAGGAPLRWLRMRVTRVLGTPPDNVDAAFELDVHAVGCAGAGGADDGLREDNWLFLGDTYAGRAMRVVVSPAGSRTIAQLVHERDGARYPVVQNALVFADHLDATVVDTVARWIRAFRGRYVAVSFGGQQAVRTPAGGGCAPGAGCDTEFRAGLAQVLQTVLTAQRIAVVAHLPAMPTPDAQRTADTFNAAIDAVVAALGGASATLVYDPAPWRFTDAGLDAVYLPASAEDRYLNPAGELAFRREWVERFAPRVYPH